MQCEKRIKGESIPNHMEYNTEKESGSGGSDHTMEITGDAYPCRDAIKTTKEHKKIKKKKKYATNSLCIQPLTSASSSSYANKLKTTTSIANTPTTTTAKKKKENNQRVTNDFKSKQTTKNNWVDDTSTRTRRLRAVNKSTKQSKCTKFNKLLPPELLLSYTYFLNAEHTCYITIGYDVESFELRIIMLKDKVFQIWTFCQWDYLMQNAAQIQCLFQCEPDNGADNKNDNYFVKTSRSNSDELYIKLKKHKETKFLILFNGSSEIVLYSSEWAKFFALSWFLNTIVNWYSATWPEIQHYYNAYSAKCNIMQLNELPSNEFFVLAETQSYCNFSRLFNEIPVLCANKIQNDRGFRKFIV